MKLQGLRVGSLARADRWSPVGARGGGPHEAQGLAAGGPKPSCGVRVVVWGTEATPTQGENPRLSSGAQ